MADESILWRCLQAIQSLVISLHLDGMPDANVLVQKVHSDHERYLNSTEPLPCILIAPYGPEGLERNGGTNLESDIVYPVRLIILDVDRQDQEINFDRNLLWRQLIINKLNDRRLAGITEVRRVTVQPGPIVDPGGWAKGKYISGIGLAIESRQARIP